jgi:hypothetical protein
MSELPFSETVNPSLQWTILCAQRTTCMIYPFCLLQWTTTRRSAQGYLHKTLFQQNACWWKLRIGLTKNCQSDGRWAFQFCGPHSGPNLCETFIDVLEKEFSRIQKVCQLIGTLERLFVEFVDVMLVTPSSKYPSSPQPWSVRSPS